MSAVYRRHAPFASSLIITAHGLPPTQAAIRGQGDRVLDAQTLEDVFGEARH
ncbi:MAG: hypothetical protein IPH35_07205 [Rhodoferax sp.]|nr:hypothetical protein [Rhodoferax sp.]